MLVNKQVQSQRESRASITLDCNEACGNVTINQFDPDDFAMKFECTRGFEEPGNV